MAREVPMDRALSDEDRDYLNGRGRHDLVDLLDERYGGDQDDVMQEAPYEEWTVDELREEIDNRNTDPDRTKDALDRNGKKAELVARLRADDQ